MNILFLSSKKRWGGVMSWMQKITIELEKKGHNVWIVSHPNSRFTKSEPKELKIISQKLGMDYNPSMIFFLARFIKKNEIDLIVTNIQKEIIIGGVAAKITGIPNICRVGREDDFNEKTKIKLHHHLFVDHFVVPCDLMKKRGLKKYKWLKPNDITSIYNGRNSKIFSEDEIRQQRKEWGLSEKDFIIGTTSQITKVKRIDNLIYVFQEVLKEHPECYLVITGEGPEKQNIENIVRELKISRKTIFAGFSSNPMKSAAAYDIAVSNSSFEGFPNTVVEYFAAGKPVITTNVGGVTEMVKNEENGLLIDYGNQEQLLNKIVLLIENPDLRKRLSQNALETIKNGFSEDVMIEKFEALFQEIINQRKI